MFQGHLFRKGFTLLELMIIIAITGILASSIFPNMTQYFSRARDAQRLNDINTIAKAIDTYYIDRELYPIHRQDWDSAAIPRSNCATMPFAGSPDTHCWGNPESINTTNIFGGPTRLIPKEYLDDIPLDPRNFDDGDPCSFRTDQMSYLYTYASENSSQGYVLVTRLENIPGTHKVGTYTGVQIGCTGYANYGIIQGNGGRDISLGIVGR